MEKKNLIKYGIPYRDNEQFEYVGSNDKAKIILGWQPETSLEEGIKKTIEWHKNIISD